MIMFFFRPASFQRCCSFYCFSGLDHFFFGVSSQANSQPASSTLVSVSRHIRIFSIEITYHLFIAAKYIPIFFQLFLFSAQFSVLFFLPFLLSVISLCHFSPKERFYLGPTNVAGGFFFFRIPCCWGKSLFKYSYKKDLATLENICVVL